MDGGRETLDWLDQIHGALRRITSDAWQLRDLGNAFERMGNEVVCGELYGVATELEGCQEDISRALGRHLKEEIAVGDEINTLLVQAALAGITVGKRGEE
jgi:hypothetical protein